MCQSTVVAVVPAYNPDEKLLKTLTDLKQTGWTEIIVVNDGSDARCDEIFAQARSAYGCHVLTHAVNQGYGRALKTAFNYFLLNYPDCIGVVTLDADGQHTAEDALRCAQALVCNPACLVLGCRDFRGAHVPWKSRAGNVITRNVFRFLCGIKVSDTQTGLRAFSREFAQKLIGASGERYEFCSSVLIEAKKRDIPIREVNIHTIYLEGNSSSHFRALRDSARIYALILQFLLSSLASFAVDIVLFSILLSLTSELSLAYNTLIATFIARLGSAVFNYRVNRSLVFRKGQQHSLIKYGVICALQTTASYFSVFWLSKLMGFNPIPVKIVVDMLLFLISFQIQREWVFRRHAQSPQS
ncbi:MAG: glycosyltransferase [Acetanaerobacterium sp.]